MTGPEAEAAEAMIETMLGLLDGFADDDTEAAEAIAIAVDFAGRMAGAPEFPLPPGLTAGELRRALRRARGELARR